MSKLLFINDGIESIPNFFDKKECKKLLNQALKKIDFKNIFKSEKIFKKSKKFKDVNPVVGNKPRISVRILIEKNSKKIQNCSIDRVNKKIIGKLSLTKTRKDLTDSGKSKIKRNFLYLGKII
jgi:hypothetical protein